MIILYITEKNIFVVIVYKLLVQKINGKQRIIMPKKGEYIKFKNFERLIKSPFIIYADFESILVPENNEKQNPNEFYTNVGDTFSKP